MVPSTLFFENLLDLINDLLFSAGTMSTVISGSIMLWYILDFTLDLVFVPVGILNILFDC